MPQGVQRTSSRSTITASTPGPPSLQAFQVRHSRAMQVVHAIQGVKCTCIVGCMPNCTPGSYNRVKKLCSGLACSGQAFRKDRHVCISGLHTSAESHFIPYVPLYRP